MFDALGLGLIITAGLMILNLLMITDIHARAKPGGALWLQKMTSTYKRVSSWGGPGTRADDN